MMRFPCLVNPVFCKTPIEVTIERESTNEYGEPHDDISWSGRCNYQDKAKTIYTKQKKELVITGTVLIPGDIAPEVETISTGSVIKDGIKRRIVQGTKARNPDGTVNYTKLELE